MNIAKFGRILIAVAVFIFAVGGAIYFGKKQSQRGQIEKQNVFCLACLEGQYYKSKTWMWKAEPNSGNWDELIYLTKELAVSERAMLIKLLTHFSAVAQQERFKEDPLAQWAEKLYKSWEAQKAKINIRLPYFARFENAQAIWPSEPGHDFFGAAVSGSFGNQDWGLILLNPTQTEFDATLTLAHALFLLFDPASSLGLPSRELENHWLHFRAFLVEIRLWHLFNRFFESPVLSYYHYQNYPQFWQQMQNKNYFKIWSWMIDQYTKKLVPLVHQDSYFLVRPPLQGKMPVEPVEVIRSEGTDMYYSLWNQLLKVGPHFDGILVGAKLFDPIVNKENLMKRLIADMHEYISKADPFFRSDDPETIFNRFHGMLGKNGVDLPEQLTAEINPSIRGEF